MVEICFQYDEAKMSWEVIAKCCVSELGALQAFNAVLITASTATPKVLHNKANKLANNSYKISIGL